MNAGFVARIAALVGARVNPPRLDVIEPGVRCLVDALNATGLVETFTSCEGHFGYRNPAGDHTDREQVNVGFFLRDGVAEERLARFFGDVLASVCSQGDAEAELFVSKRFVAALEERGPPEVFFEFTLRPRVGRASNEAKRRSADRALAAVTRAVERHRERCVHRRVAAAG